jgi:hypothetical protein
VFPGRATDKAAKDEEVISLEERCGARLEVQHAPGSASGLESAVEY